MAYDPDLGSTVLFGGIDGNGRVLGDTWTYDSATSTWSLLPSVTSPAPRAFLAMAYDPTDHLMVLFGGYSGQGTFLGDTWGLTASGNWENLTPSPQTPLNTPVPRIWEGLATSFASGVVLYGGYTVQAGVLRLLGDTWSFTLATGWVELCLKGSCGPTTPGPLFGAAFAYDSLGGDDVLFGGDFGPSYANATWIYNSTGWYNLTDVVTPPAPGARAFATMTELGGLQTVIGGIAPNGGEYSDAWMFNPPPGTAFWTALGNVLPYGGAYAASASDPVTGDVLLCGELNFTYGPTSNLEEWQAGGFNPVYGPPGSSPPTSNLVEMAYDAADGYVVAVSPGTNVLFPTTWRYANGAWTNITPNPVTPTSSPPSKVGPAMAYDAADREVILYGGENLVSGQFSSDTWAFSAGSWTNITPSASPPALFFPSLAPTFPGGPLVLFGGVDVTSTVTAGTWTFLHGSWTSRAPAVSPPARAAAASTWDGSQHAAILYGGDGVSAWLDDTWRFDLINDTWTPLCQPACTGVVLAYPSMTFDPLDNKTIMVAGQTGGAFFFHAGSWAVQNTLPAPLPRWLAAMAYDGRSSDGYVLLYGGGGVTGSFRDTWAFAPELNLSSPVANRTELDATEQTVSLSANVTGGGAGTILESWMNLPGGCTQLTGTSISCTPTQPGNYTVFNEANTSGGIPLVSGGVVELQVDPALSLAAVPTANRTDVTVGAPVELWANATGGTGTYIDRWHGVSSAACTGSQEMIVCGFPAPGSYNVSLTVTDSNMESLTTAAVTLTVQSTPVVVAPVASPDPVEVGAPLSLSAVVVGGAAPLSVVWSGLPAGCASADAVSLSCTPTTSGNFGVKVTVSDANGAVFTSPTLALSVLTPPPKLTVSATATPPSGAAPLQVQFQATVQGGAPPVVLSWNFGDGVRGVGVSPLHTYGGAGPYLAEVWANDSQGGSAETSIAVSVRAPSLQAYLEESPTSVTSGGTVDWNVEVSGGTAPYAVRWTGLPSGCPSVGTNVSCTMTTDGTFTVSATVTDQEGSSANVSATLTVLAASSAASSSPASPPLWVTGPLLGGLIVGALLLVVGLRRRRSPPSSPRSSAEPSTPKGGDDAEKVPSSPGTPEPAPVPSAPSPPSPVPSPEVGPPPPCPPPGA